MKVEVELQPFRFPNFLRIGGDRVDQPALSVGELSDDEAVAYWESMREYWMGHVRERRKLLPKGKGAR